MPAPYALSQVSPAGIVRAAEQEIENASQSSREGPWRRGTDLYLVGQTGFGGVGGFITVCKSTDNGATWVEQDVAGRPACGGDDVLVLGLRPHLRTFNVARDGVGRTGNLLYVVYSAPGAGPVPGFLAMASFNMATDTWGAAFVSAIDVNVNVGFGPTTTQPRFNLEYRDQLNDLIALNYSMVYSITPAGVFTFLGTLGPFAAGDGCGYTTCLSRAGGQEWVHCFTEHRTVAVFPIEGWLCHQSVDLANNLSVRQNIVRIAGNAVPAGFIGSTTPGPPAQQLDALGFALGAYADSQDVVCPYMCRTFYVAGQPPVASDLVCVGMVARGVPGPSPVWSTEEFYRQIGAFAPPVGRFFNGACATRNSATSRLAVARNDWSLSQNLIGVENTGGAVWGPDLLLAVGTRTMWWPVNAIEDPGTDLGYAVKMGYGDVGGVLSPNDSDILTMWVMFGAPLPPPAPPSPPVARGGTHRMVVLVPNRFDMALGMERLAASLVKHDNPCCNPALWRNVMEVRVPANYRVFFKTAAIATPIPADGDVTILDFQVPEGYDGMIAGVFHGYTGPGFLEGNGDLEWRLLVNRTYAMQMGQMLVSLGLQRQPFLVDGGIPIQSGKHVRYIINAPNLSGGILPVNSRIFAGVEGFFYARS